MNNQFDVIVIGGGAAGLFCAFTAAKRGKSVLVLEKANKVGKKILMSGGGKCNFTNHFVEANNYICANPHFVKSALSQYSQWDFIAMVCEYGIEYEERDHSQLFCLNSAKDILNMLLDECEQGGVQIRTSSAVTQVKFLDNQYQVMVNEHQTISCKSLVVASGALSIPTLGGSGYGYELAKQFNMPLIERRAGLAPLMFSDQFKAVCERLSGLALPVTISCNDQSFTENLLFTHRGISGPSVLQISNYWYPGDEVEVDLLPSLDAGEWLLQLKKEQGKSLLRTQLAQQLAKPLAKELQDLYWPQMAEKALAEFSDQLLKEIGHRLNHWHLKPSASEGYRTAEVTLGGVDTDAISSKTMEAKNQPGLYFIGEVLDVSGHLGGFNFQWAWSSAYVAGQSL